MPANGNYLVFLTAATLAFLLALILVAKLHAFVALLISSMAMGLAAGMAPEKVLKSIQTGFGEALGFIAVGMVYGPWIARRIHIDVPGIAATLTRAPETAGAPPVPMVILLLVLPVLLTFGGAMANLSNIPFKPVAVFFGHSYTALLIT